MNNDCKTYSKESIELLNIATNYKVDDIIDAIESYIKTLPVETVLHISDVHIRYEYNDFKICSMNAGRLASVQLNVYEKIYKQDIRSDCKRIVDVPKYCITYCVYTQHPAASKEFEWHADINVHQYPANYDKYNGLQQTDMELIKKQDIRKFMKYYGRNYIKIMSD